MNGELVDEDGYQDLECECGGVHFVLQTDNGDESLLKTICWECKKEVLLRVEKVTVYEQQ